MNAHKKLPTTTVDVRIRGSVSGIGRETVRKRALAILAELNLRDVELSIVLCDDPFIHVLNHDFRGKDKATDVLSFPMSSPQEPLVGTRMLGDVIVSVDTAARQAVAAKHSLRRECSFLLIHGILHLIGYTHETDRDEARMNRETARLLSIIEK